MASNLFDEDEFNRLMEEEQRKKGVFDEAALAKILKQKVIGQDKVADQITKQIKRRFAQLKINKGKIEKPLGVFLLAGPPGVGKTYFSKILAENMYDGKGKLLHYDMTQYKQSHSLSGLIGSPPGYVGGQGSLTSGLLQNPRYIVLLDELEKAHTDIHKAFLTAWNDGFMTDAHTGKRIKTTEALFMLTTNAAWERLVEIERTMTDDPTAHDNAVQETLKQADYAPEVLSRIDNVFIFDQLDAKGLGRVAALEIQSLAGRYGLEVVKLNQIYLYRTASQDRFKGTGIRDLTRVLEGELGDQMLDRQQEGAEAIEVDLDDDEKPVVKRAEKPKAAAAAKTSASNTAPQPAPPAE